MAVCFPLHSAAAGQEARIQSSAHEVLVDFVARDKHQKLVRDLRPEEVEVYEDGVRQTPTSFEYSDGRETEAAPRPSGPPGAADPLRGINIVTVVFADMSPSSRRQGARMVREFLAHQLQHNTWAGVFLLWRRLSVLQPYTRDVDLLNAAVDRAASSSVGGLARENAGVVKRLNSLKTIANPNQFRPIEAGSAEEQGPATGVSLAARIEMRMLQMTLAISFEQQGADSIDALRTLVRQQAALPGRKTVLFVSEGLVIPPDQPKLMRSIVSEANRSNVTFFTLDPRGLEIPSSLEIGQATSAAIAATSTGSSGDLADPSLHTNLQENARELAEDTGGFAMANSNDLRSGLARVMEDVNSHYELTYSPTSQDFDGHFRRIRVMTSRRGVTIQSRSGYYALPLLNGAPLAAYEVAALNALRASPRPEGVRFAVSAFGFRATPEGDEVRLLFDVPIASLHVSEGRNAFRLHASALALIKDEHGHVAAKVSRDLPFQATSARLAEFRKGRLTFDLPVWLAPGQYRVEAVALDQDAVTAGVREFAFTAPAALADQPALGAFLWIRAVEPRGADPDWSNPFDTPDGKLTPRVEPAVFATSEAPAFLCVLYPSPGATGLPELHLSVSQAAQRLSDVKLKLPPHPNPDGSFSITGRLPLNGLAPGAYEVALTAAQGGRVAASRAAFQVRPE